MKEVLFEGNLSGDPRERVIGGEGDSGLNVEVVKTEVEGLRAQLTKVTEERDVALRKFSISERHFHFMMEINTKACAAIRDLEAQLRVARAGDAPAIVSEEMITAFFDYPAESKEEWNWARHKIQAGLDAHHAARAEPKHTPNFAALPQDWKPVV